ncbi:MAG: hypothetical protein LCI00_05545 [Chloroflexi bacterium]|nr:hypothetical protein [Chloroflexota bacterium]
MTFTQLIATLALGLIGLGLIGGVTLIAHGFWQLHVEQRDKRRLIARFEELKRAEK